MPVRRLFLVRRNSKLPWRWGLACLQAGFWRMRVLIVAEAGSAGEFVGLSVAVRPMALRKRSEWLNLALNASEMRRFLSR